MGNSLVSEKTVRSDNVIQLPASKKLPKPELPGIHTTLVKIRTEGGEDFLQYLRMLYLAKEPNLLAISSTHYYYYEFNELRNIKTLINLKKLNNVKQLESFISIIARILPQKANFIGNFKSSDQESSVSLFYKSSKLFGRMVNYIESITDRSLTKDKVARLLEEHNLRVVDFTDINGISYFCSRIC